MRKILLFLGLLFFTYFIVVSPVLAQNSPVVTNLYPANSNYYQVKDGDRNYIKSGNVTNNPKVLLEITSNLDQPIVQMRFSETGAWDSVPWQQYSVIQPWIFSVENDQVPLYAQFKLANDEVVSASRMFVVDQSPPDMQFSLRDRSIGPGSIPDLVGLVVGRDRLSPTQESYRMAYPGDIQSEPWVKLTSNQPVLQFTRWGSRRYLESEDGEVITVAFQAKDSVGNTTPVMTDSLVIDVTEPLVYAKAEPSKTLRSSLYIEAYDKHSALENIYLSNDPESDEYMLYNHGTVRPFESKITWMFGPSRSVWVGVTDVVGNRSIPILVNLDQPDDVSSVTITPSPGYEVDQPSPSQDQSYQEFREKIAQLEQQQHDTYDQLADVQTTLQIQQSLIQKIIGFLSKLWPW